MSIQQRGLALAYYALHRTKDADAALARLEATGRTMRVAEVYAFRGQKDPALKWLERAYAEKPSGFCLVKGDPLLKNLEGDPRDQASLRKMNLLE